jgi:hypothetical protein
VDAGRRNCRHECVEPAPFLNESAVMAAQRLDWVVLGVDHCPDRGEVEPEVSQQQNLLLCDPRALSR